MFWVSIWQCVISYRSRLMRWDFLLSCFKICVAFSNIYRCRQYLVGEPQEAWTNKSTDHGLSCYLIKMIRLWNQDCEKMAEKTEKKSLSINHDIWLLDEIEKWKKKISSLKRPRSFSYIHSATWILDTEKKFPFSLLFAYYSHLKLKKVPPSYKTGCKLNPFRLISPGLPFLTDDAYSAVEAILPCFCNNFRYTYTSAKYYLRLHHPHR